MQILIGGSPGTGSSLLRQMLNRHSSVYCGPETRLFTHPGLFHHWHKMKKAVLLRGRLSPSLNVSRGVNLHGAEQMWQHDDVKELVKEVPSFREFCDKYFGLTMTKYNKVIWGEKSPDNVRA